MEGYSPAGMSPTLSERMAVRERPVQRVAGRQRWSDLLFAHWQVEPGLVQAMLPPGLFVDTFEGAAYVGVVPFFMERIRPVWLPPLPWVSWFLELNVRTYVHDGQGRPGVWFFSLDCNQPLAVALARRFFHLPYLRARMSARRCGTRIDYRCQRIGVPGPPCRFEWDVKTEGVAAEPGSLEFFLVERYRLFSADCTGRLFEGRVHHAPYRIYRPEAGALSAESARQAGFDVRGEPVSLLGARQVDVSIFLLTPLRPGIAG